ncbi:kinesin-related protein 12-like [Vigna unguiculata]|uniref:Uncharacterized protein n=1 Tax=Vigna unguiculata TaxID=3917 RepID=A0A4D6N873_VIGUN|nr:kinesin-related protein 12-like [Vigna unguiculata]QCE08147.1 hypothetical protein DEO72_LG9g3172 [Vigna unguiculata]
MGNCFFGAMSDPHAPIKVITSNGGIMEFSAPVTVSFITNEFPGHAIFRSHDLFWKPLSQFQELEAGQSYYLLPLNNNNTNNTNNNSSNNSSNNDNIDIPCGVGENVNVVRQGHVRSHSVPTTSYPALYRMSLDYQHHHLKRSSIEAFSSSNIHGGVGGSSRFWKVKLVITPEQLLDILAQEARTKELLQSVRMVAKCGDAAGTISDQWNLSSTSWSISSKIDALVGI